MSALVIRGAREHNLRSLDLALPLQGLVVVTGVSGSGKSSLVFDTLHAEGRRRYVEALGLAASSLRRPAVDRIEGLPPTVALRQHERAPGPLDTLGSLSGIEALLAVIWARGGVQHDPQTGEAIRPTSQDAILRELLDAPEGSRLHVEAPLLPSEGSSMVGLLDELRRAGFSRVRIDGEVRRLDEIPERREVDPRVRVVVDRLKVAPDRRPRLAEALRLASAAGRGILVAHFDDHERVFVDRPFSLSTRRTFPELRPARFSWRGAGRCRPCEGRGQLDGRTCPACGGARLDEAARHVLFRGHSLPGLQALPLAEALARLQPTDSDPAVEIALADVRDRLERLRKLGLGAVSLDRRAAFLSVSEWQRLRLARTTSQDLSGVLYLLDEPTAGLHPSLVPAVIELLVELVQRGNGVIAVSHREALVRAAQTVLELGPGAGADGGAVLHAGSVEELRAGQTPTGRWLAGDLGTPSPPPVQTEIVEVGPLPALRDLVIELQLEGLTVLEGAPGAGTSQALVALAAHVGERGGVGGLDRVLRVEPVRIGSARSMVATYVGLWDVLRELLAATTEASIRGLTSSHFSLATPGGRCESCKGTGEVKVDLGLLPPVFLSCEICEGQRFQEELLDITWKGRDPAQLLQLSALEAYRLLAGHPRLERTLRALVDVGLGYVPLGQPTRDLSGGEGARLRLARELGRSALGVKGALLVLDGPTDGLHPVDARSMIRLLHELGRSGATVVAASHDPLVLAAAHLRVPVHG
ncbi:MAG: hypothetical protein EA397_06205 [Deltaproteobacteria bacterium]|nr:MAG: hypothetical protein EA397_06205 [Deltaproteobacteria bacterium]